MNSKICVRMLTRDKDTTIDREFLTKRLRAAWDYRKKTVDTSSCRIVFGDADFLFVNITPPDEVEGRAKYLKEEPEKRKARLLKASPETLAKVARIKARVEPSPQLKRREKWILSLSALFAELLILFM